MKIAIASENQLKFMGDLKNHWESRGHEVKYEMGASEHLAQWADLYFVDSWTNNIHYLFDLYHGDPRGNRTPDWDNNKKPIVVCRALDHEVWIGLARDQRIIDWVDHSICIAPHIERQLRKHNEWNNLHLIPIGVDTDKFEFIKRIHRYNIVLPCNEIDWHLKNVSEGLKIFAMLKKKTPDFPWHLTIKGKYCQGEYFKVFHEDLIDKLGIRKDVTIIEEQIPDYNAFLDEMDFCLVPSYKEAYSYVTAECASKGIKPILNHWYGAEELWPKEWLYTTPDRAVEMFLEPYSAENIRGWVYQNSNVKTMLKKYDELLGT